MTPTLIVLALLALGVGIVAFATRRAPDQPAPAVADQETGWQDPVTPGGLHPFAHAPELVSDPAVGAQPAEPRSLPRATAVEPLS